MAQVFGKEMKKIDILKRVGDIDQLAHINRIELKEGDANGVRALDVRNGGGLRFISLLDRGLDISTAEFNGIPLAVRFHPGEMRPNFHEDLPFAFLKSWGGGLVTTCGLTQVGDPGRDGMENLVQHGEYTHISAKNVQYEGIWEGDEYRLQIRGRITEGAVFFPNMELRRKITTYMGSNKFIIEDEIENIGFKPSPFMILYHCNFGFPLVDAGSEVFIRSNSVTAREGDPTYDIDLWNEIVEPEDEYENRDYFHDVEPDEDGICRVGIKNDNICDGKDLKLTIKYDKKKLPILKHWKRMLSGQYTVALEPTNCHSAGRVKEREVFKSLRYIEPGQKESIWLEFEVELS
jgi:hypothetical protein